MNKSEYFELKIDLYIYLIIFIVSLLKKKKENVKKIDDFAPIAKWDEIISYVKTNGGMPIFSHLKKATVQNIRNEVGLVFDETGLMSKSVISKPGNLELVEKAVEAVTGEKIAVRCYTSKEVGTDTKADPLKELEELAKSHSVIEII